ncbi:hypothetical protein AB0G79_03785 [Streptomyces sp. NPDC020807]|uniref:hypothetical protein n=1 Tax=Streptomyces sp. NPDC020807 TaxID=3155119 RepID=UPI003411ECAC
MAGTDGGGGRGGRGGGNESYRTDGKGSPIIVPRGTTVINFKSLQRFLEALPLLVAIAVVAYTVQTWPGGPQNQYALFYGFLVVGFVCSVAYAVRGKGWLALTLALAGTLLAFGTHAYIARNGEVTVTVTAPDRLTPSVAHEIAMAAPPPGKVRDRLRITLAFYDVDPAAPTCVHRTTGTLSATTAGVTPSSVLVTADSPVVDLDLGGNQGAVVLSLVPHTGPTCAMRLGTVTGTLHNR